MYAFHLYTYSFHLYLYEAALCCNYSVAFCESSIHVQVYMFCLDDFHIAVCTFIIVVSFVPTNYNVTEGVNPFAEMTLVRSGNTNKTATVIVCTRSGTAIGMSNHPAYT